MNEVEEEMPNPREDARRLKMYNKLHNTNFQTIEQARAHANG